jgi:hypothetical protein
VGQFGILGIDGACCEFDDNPTEFLGRPLFSGATPTALFVGLFAVTVEPIKSGDIGRAVASGVTPVKVDVVDEGHPAADVHVGQTATLKSAPSGAAQILYKGSGTGIKWALVRLMQRGLPRGAYDNEVPCWDATEGRWYAGPVRAV